MFARLDSPADNKMFLSVVFVGLIAAWTCFGAPSPGRTTEPNVQTYLQKFGYLQTPNPETGSLISEDHFSDAVKTFQNFANLPMTGVLDSETKMMMSAPRCGNVDITDDERPTANGRNHRRRKRFVLQGSKWKVKDLTWSVSQSTNQLTLNDVETQLSKAWKIWSDSSGLTFTKSSGGNVHIDVRFAKFEHGDGDPFDGQGKTLAHAFFPQYGGDAHFDDSEAWTTGRYGTNLYQVAAHEFGHSLGLSHSNVKSSLMAPFYRGYDDNLKLDPDDVAAIQDIYGAPSRSGPGSGWNRLSGSLPSSLSPTSRRPTQRKPVNPPGSRGETDSTSVICQSPSIDAITITADGNTYAFKNDMYYALSDNGIELEYPRRISEDWKGLPSNIDAALTWSDGKTFFFKGNKYWRFANKKALAGYPKLISKGFAGIPDNIDAVFTWGGNSKTYFIKGRQYWRYDSAAEVPVSSDYPKSLGAWDGLPSQIDAAFQWKNGKTFFFSGSEYFRFNDQKFSVEVDYPRSSGVWWFGCGSDSKKDFVDSSANVHALSGSVDADNQADFQGTMNDAPPQQTVFTVVREDAVPGDSEAAQHGWTLQDPHLPEAQVGSSTALVSYVWLLGCCLLSVTLSKLF